MNSKSTFIHCLLFIVIFVAIVFADRFLPAQSQVIKKSTTIASLEELYEEQELKRNPLEDVVVPELILDELHQQALKRKPLTSHQWFKTASYVEQERIVEEVSDRLYQHRDYLLLIEMLEKLGDKYGMAASVKFYSAAANSRVGDVEKAIVQYQTLVEYFPNHQAGLLNLAILLRKQQRFNLSNQVLHRAENVSAGRKLAKAQSLLASNYREMGQLELAREYFISSIEYRPNHAATWLKLANVEAELDLPATVVMQTFERAAALGVDQANVFFRAGSYGLSQGLYQRALPLLEKASALEASDDEYRKALAWVETELGNLAAASKHWQWLKVHSSDADDQLLAEHMFLALNQQRRERLKPLPKNLEGQYGRLFISQLQTSKQPKHERLLASKKWQTRTNILLAKRNNPSDLSLNLTH